MRLFKDERLITKVLTGIECDCCHEVFTDELDLQEMLNWSGRGGFRSVFGDGASLSLDLCQHCLKKRLGDVIRVDDSIT